MMRLSSASLVKEKVAFACFADLRGLRVPPFLDDEHGVSVGVEAEFFFDCFLVGFYHEVVAGKGGDEHEES